jgi:hypothetical protein
LLLTGCQVRDENADDEIHQLQQQQQQQQKQTGSI